jgi:hypothetical protein
MLKVYLLVGSLLAFGQTLPPKRVTGVTDPAVTQANIHTTICVSGYTSKVRNVTEAEKHAVYTRDHLQPKKGICCEVDHLISLEIGGSNDIDNLWAQPYEPRPGAHEKDKLENALHKDICSGKITLIEAQKAISTNWYKEYQTRFPDSK